MSSIKPLRATVFVAAALAAGVVRATPTPSCPSSVDAASFVAGVDNPYFPLSPGTTFFYEGQKDGVPARDEFYVTHDTTQILGVTCTVVRDRAFENAQLVEETFDWFAQDRDGNVWYFGEDTTEYENGVPISHEGSWRAGVAGALPGIVMEAHPHVGDKYAQECAPSVAQDMAQVQSVSQSVTVPYGSYDDVLR